MIEIVVVLLDDGLASTAIGPMEVFRSAGVVWNQLNGKSPKELFNVQATSLAGQSVDSDGPIMVQPNASLDQITKADVIFIPAIGLNVDSPMTKHQSLIPWLQGWHKKGAYIAGVCSGVALLAEAGLLDGRPATTHWGLIETYKTLYPNVRWQPELFITGEDRVYCGGGVYASLDLSLYLVEKLVGHEVAVECSRALLIDRPRRWQSSFAAPPRRSGHQDEKIRKAQDWLHMNFSKDFHFDELANRVGMSPRNFSRRFCQAVGETPLTYQHKLRVTQSKKLLEKDYKTVQEIARDVGYEDVVFFRKLFKRYTGLSPKTYRQKFGQEHYASSEPT